jgi:hypothetical protein
MLIGGLAGLHTVALKICQARLHSGNWGNTNTDKEVRLNHFQSFQALPQIQQKNFVRKFFSFLKAYSQVC